MTHAQTSAAALSVADADACIEALGPRRSLCPSRAVATSLATLATAAPEPLRASFERCLARIAFAQVEAFPENIFWDFDALAHSLLDQASEASEAGAGEAILDRLGADVASLQSLFGAGSAIHFRYVHDFSYGYDWSKWVRRDPGACADRPPFGSVFIEYSLRRGHELLDLIAADDTKYPKLPDGKPRNPFGFSRNRSDEVRLFRHLAQEDLLPLRAWETHPEGRWDRDYRALRDAEAKNLGL
ncbi:MAG: hypothetical protein ACI9KE_005297 [Polyangiales bacterium]|jgi:hypothetical protein